MKKLLLLSCTFIWSLMAVAQTSITCTDTVAAQVMMGIYNPADYLASVVRNHPDTISNGMHTGVSADSLYAYLDKLRTFYNRNSAADTLSATRGMGAARRWVYSKFAQFSNANEDRLLPAYLQFNYNICGVQQHRNIMAVLPGTDTGDKSVIVIEGHIDSRNADLCDSIGVAQGMEDNATGTALVMELARVMSRYSFDHTLVFFITTGEEQGLVGATAFSDYALLHNIKIKAVLNNDVIGGIFCGHTSSAPGCPGFGDIDSTHVRMFSFGGFNSFHKGLARYIKLQYKERILPTAAVPMGLHVMTPEDRSGRGGDHIPFRQDGFTAMRFTAANENGNADVTSSTYQDRQHTDRDSLGIDADGDGVLDTMLLDVRYLARNAVINGNAAGIIAISPAVPDFSFTSLGGGNVQISITAHPEYLHYKIGMRTTTYDWDSVYEFSGTLTHVLALPAGTYIASVCSVDSLGVESTFSRERMLTNGIVQSAVSRPQITLLQNKPNPSDEATSISVVVTGQVSYKEAYIVIKDLNGKEVERQPVTLTEGVNELMYHHGYHATGTYLYTLIVDGQALQTRKMTFIN